MIRIPMLLSILRNAGVRPPKIQSALRGWWRYRKDRAKYRSIACANPIEWGEELPMLTEWDDHAGSLGAYFYQDQVAARWVLEANPSRHVDVGSRIDGFVGSISVFRHVDVLDIRPLPQTIPNVTFHQVNLMNPLPPEWVECTDSLSCLHTIEHFGLGRYNDPIDPLGHIKGMAQLKRMVRPGGRLLLSTPLGRERIEFNAHRIFSPATLLSWFADGWTITRSAVIDDSLEVHETPDASALRIVKCDTGVGIVCAVKPA